MRIEATAVVLSLLLGGLLNTAAAQRIISDRPSPKPAPRPAPKAAAGPAEHPSRTRSVVKKSVHRPDPLADRLLSPDEGLTVIAAALGAHIRHASGDDCSQLVHEIYERAGFSYPYTNSWDLYDGSHSFRRIWKPQPGDLVVWQGHVGIVVSPSQHLFFSRLTSTGQDIASYDAAYWRSRGHARFFRYLKPEGADGMERAAAPRRRRPPVRQVAEAEPAHSPAPAGFDAAAPDDDLPASVSAEARSPAVDAPPLLNVRRPRPEQVRQAILEELLHAAPALSDAQAPALSHPLIVFDDLRVERVRLDGDQGWAEVRIHQMGAVRSGRAEVVRRTERAFWTLRRRDGDWEIVTPQETTYLPRSAAVPVIAHQLVLLPHHPGDAQTGAPQKKSLARLLNVLLEP
jgi:hypothetical protein